MSVGGVGSSPGLLPQVPVDPLLNPLGIIGLVRVPRVVDQSNNLREGVDVSVEVVHLVFNVLDVGIQLFQLLLEHEANAIEGGPERVESPYRDFETIRSALDGICFMFEKKLKE